MGEQYSLVVSKVLGGFFISSDTVSYPDGFGQERGVVAVLLLENSRGRLVSEPKFSRDLFYKKIIIAFSGLPRMNGLSD